MRIALITDTFPPQRSSAAVQLRDLALEFIRNGHQLTIILPESEIHRRSALDEVYGISILQLKTPRLKGYGYFGRTVNEFLMPFFMRSSYRHSFLNDEKWGAVIWYSPSIFHGPFVKMLKKKSNCKTYLIIRDIFPEWALDLGLINSGLPYLLFKIVAFYQYSVADIIGVQSTGNLSYFDYWSKKQNHIVEVLPNWLGEPGKLTCSINISNTKLAGRKVFVYSGNMGIAQGLGILIELVKRFSHKPDIGFLFVGRGSEMEWLKTVAKKSALDNILFFDEIHPDEIPGLYKQCSVGIVTLDYRHKTHNIPGKVLSYLQNGLPCLAAINRDNDLVNFIQSERIGEVCNTNNINELVDSVNNILLRIKIDDELSARCMAVFVQYFSAASAANQIVESLERKN